MGFFDFSDERELEERDGERKRAKKKGKTIWVFFKVFNDVSIVDFSAKGLPFILQTLQERWLCNYTFNTFQRKQKCRLAC